jgi:hypothetical protein
MTRPTTLLAIAGLAAAAAGQAPTVTQGTTVFLSLDWSDINGTPNHILERGESVLFQLSVSFTNQNTVASFTPPVGTYSSGTIRAYSSSHVDLRGAASAEGSWDVDPSHGYGVIPEWDLIGPPGYGTPQDGGASLIDILFGQFSGIPSTMNPIPNIWSGLWTPESYAPRAVSFTLGPGTHSGGLASSVLLRTAPSLAVSAYCPSTFGSVLIPIVPTPGPLAPFFLAAALARPRRFKDSARLHALCGNPRKPRPV